MKKNPLKAFIGLKMYNLGISGAKDYNRKVAGRLWDKLVKQKKKKGHMK